MIKIQASSVHRVLSCPASARLEMSVPNDQKYRPFKDAATFGSQCHNLAEQRLKEALYKGEKPKALKNELRKACRIGKFSPADFERAFNAVHEYEKHVKKVHRKHVKYNGDTIVLIEEKARLKNKDFEAVAKADAAIVTLTEKGEIQADFFDLKTGNFDYSESASEQILFGALLYLSNIRSLEGKVIDKSAPVCIRCHTVQPNYYAAAKKVYIYTVKVKTFETLPAMLSLEFIDPVVEYQASVNPGGHCKFCPAVLQCPAMQETAFLLEALKITSSPVDDLPTEILERFWLLKEQAEIFFKAVDAVLLERAVTGAHFENLTIASTSGHRRWTDKKEVETKLAFLGDSIYKKDLKSPAQLEKLAGKDNISGLYYTPEIKKLQKFNNPFKGGA